MTVPLRQRPAEVQGVDRGCREVTKGHPSSFSQIFITYCPTLNLGHNAQSVVSFLCPHFQPYLLPSPLVHGHLPPLPQGHARSPCQSEPLRPELQELGRPLSSCRRPSLLNGQSVLSPLWSSDLSSTPAITPFPQ